MEEELYKANSGAYARTGDVGNLTADSAGRVIFRTGKRNNYHYVCNFCGAIRYIRPSDIKRGGGRGLYCTHKCHRKRLNPEEIYKRNGEVYAKTENIANRIADNKDRIIFKWGSDYFLVCRLCGTIKKIYKSHIKNGHGYFCSRKCCNRAGQSPKFIPDLTPSPSLAYIIGVIAGDGNVKKDKNAIRLQVKDLEFAESFYSALKEIGLPPTIFRDKTLHRGGNHLLWNVYTHSSILKEFYLPLRRDIEEAKRFIKSCPNGAREFVRGFYESEGDYGKHTYKRTEKGRKPWETKTLKQLRITNTDPELISLTMELMQELGFHPRSRTEKPRKSEWKTIIRIVLSAKEQDAFIELIKPCIKNKR